MTMYSRVLSLEDQNSLPWHPIWSQLGSEFPWYASHARIPKAQTSTCQATTGSRHLNTWRDQKVDSSFHPLQIPLGFCTRVILNNIVKGIEEHTLILLEGLSRQLGGCQWMHVSCDANCSKWSDLLSYYVQYHTVPFLCPLRPTQPRNRFFMFFQHCPNS